jgi:transcriptional regulator with XRE-family HTH domain/tetratricopeptide (TPR) repeat protein
VNSFLRAARLKKCWTVEMASDEVGVSVRTFQRWEHGERIPHLSTLSLLCKAFAMSPEDLGYGALIESSIAVAEYGVSGMFEAYSPGEELLAASESIFEPANSLHEDTKRERNGRRNDMVVQAEVLARRFQEMNGGQGQSVSRRRALTYFVGLPLALQQELLQIKGSSLNLSENVLTLYEKAIPACWDLYYAGEQAEVRRVLSTYMMQLASAAQSSPKQERAGARLLSLSHQLASILALEQENFSIALEHCQQGLNYGERAGDANLQAAALMRKVDVLLFRKRHSQRFNVLQEVEQYASAVSPLLRGRIYSGLAEIYGYRQDKAAALRYIGLAQDTYPDAPEQDPVFFYTQANNYMQFSDAGLTHLHLEQHREADEAFTRASAFVPPTVNSRRVELLCWQTLTAARVGDQEQSSAYLQQAVQAVYQLGSDIYYTEASDAYACMYERWKHEPAVVRLGDLFMR